MWRPLAGQVDGCQQGPQSGQEAKVLPAEVAAPEERPHQWVPVKEGPTHHLWTEVWCLWSQP